MKNLIKVILATSALSATSFAGGGGHNGPDLNGPSIPIAVDRVMTKTELEKSITGCALGMMNEIVSQFTKSEAKLTSSRTVELDVKEELNNKDEPTGNPTPTSSIPGNYSLQGDQSFYNSNGADTGNINAYIYLNGWKQPATAAQKAASGVHFYITINDNRMNENLVGLRNDSVTFTSENMPFLSFDPIFGDAAYDEHGNLIPSAIKVTNLKLYLPETLSTAEPLYNSMTGKKAKDTVNFVKYVDCIKASVQE